MNAKEFLKKITRSGEEITHKTIMEYDKLLISDLEPLVESKAFKEYMEAEKKFYKSEEVQAYIQKRDREGYRDFFVNIKDDKEYPYALGFNYSGHRLKWDLNFSKSRLHDLEQAEEYMEEKGKKWILQVEKR